MFFGAAQDETRRTRTRQLNEKVPDLELLKERALVPLKIE
jgi:hypothetical protein